jgi:hypothetical protein
MVWFGSCLKKSMYVDLIMVRVTNGKKLQKPVPGSLDKKDGRRFHISCIFCYVKGSIFFNTVLSD